jgi:hypothetical protein
MFPRCRPTVFLPYGMFMLAACAADSSTGSGRAGSLTLSVTNRSLSTSSGLAAAAAPITLSGAGNTLVIDRVQLVLGEIELELPTADCSGSDRDADNSGPGSSGSGGCPEIELDPVLVDVPLDGPATLDLGVLVPEGTYRELEFKIEKADDDTGPEAAFLRAHPELRGVSVRVDGTFNGQPFTFRSALEAELELEFGTPVVVSAAEPLNLTIAVDVASWFRGAAGTVLDPTSAANALAIGQNIRLSFTAFEDDDRNGIEDHRG